MPKSRPSWYLWYLSYLIISHESQIYSLPRHAAFAVSVPICFETGPVGLSPTKSFRSELQTYESADLKLTESTGFWRHEMIYNARVPVSKYFMPIENTILYDQAGKICSGITHIHIYIYSKSAFSIMTAEQMTGGCLCQLGS